MHLQKAERAKLRRADRVDSVNKKKISGDRVIGWLIRSERVLLPWAIDPHGRWGPIFENFLFHHRPRAPQKPFAANRPNAQLMLARISQTPCPAGIIPTATAIWKMTKSRQFYGHSHLAPMPREHTIQQLGLGITKAFALQIRLATRKMGIRPPDRTSTTNHDIPVAAT